jgi:hypothetical protein
MAIALSETKVFDAIKKLFGEDSQQQKKVKYLLNAGHKPVLGLLEFKIVSDTGAATYAVKIPHLAMHILEPGKLSSSQLVVVAKLIDSVIEKAFTELHVMGGHTTIIPPDEDLSGMVPLKAGKFPMPKPEPGKSAFPGPEVQTETHHGFMKAGPTPAEIKAAKFPEAHKTVPVNSVIPLTEAKAVGQKVKGTSAGSFYRCFAVGRVNLAFKAGVGQLSLRAEAPDGQWDDADRKALSKLGFADHTQYMSMHVTLGSVPYTRVLGAVAFDVGVEFTEVSTVNGGSNA